MSKIKEPAADAADLLARAYVDTLAKVEGVKHQSMLRRPEQDVVAEMLADLEGEPSEDAPQLRVDLVTTAILTAKAVAEEKGLARRLRREAPIVTIATHTADMVPVVETIVCDCATSGSRRKHIIARGGTDRVRHVPEKGNSDLVAALNKRYLVAGIAPYRLSLPAIDEWVFAPGAQGHDRYQLRGMRVETGTTRFAPSQAQTISSIIYIMRK